MSSQTHAEVREFPCPGPIAAHVRVGAGAVTVVAEDQPIAVVAVSPYDDSEASRAAAENTKIQFVGDRLRVQTQDTGGGWIFRRSGRVRVDLRLPLDSRLKAQVGSADVQTEGRLAEVVIQSGSGDSLVGRTTGNLVVDSGSGAVRSADVGGSLRVHTGSGSVFAATVAGQVAVDVASGHVEIEEVGGPVRATTASGDIRIASARGGQVRLNSASGDVSVGVPVGTSVWLDLGTVSDSTTSDLEMSGAPPTGGAQLNLQVHTVSGDISVHRVGVGHT